MHKITIIPYSDEKVALKLDLNSGEFSLFNLLCEKFTKATLKGLLCDEYGIIIDDFEIINQTESETSVLIGEFEGQIKQNKTLSRTIWVDINKSLKELSGSDFKALMQLKSDYCNVLSHNMQKIGIAKQIECENMRLRHNKVSLILTKNDKIALLHEKNQLKLPITTNFLAEDNLISGYRVLKNNFNLTTELKKHRSCEIFHQNNKIFNILTGNLDESLTFTPNSFKNNVIMMKKSEIFEEITRNTANFCPESANILIKCL